MRTEEHRERTYPPSFPDGWYRVAASKEVRPGEVKHIQCLGEQIALFRSQKSGRIAALDAFCPHLGANLAYGEVKGDRLQCPFHGWQLDGNGRVCQPPRSEDPPFVQKHWETVEYYGMILIYYSTLHRKPPYQLPPQQKIDDRQLIFRGRYDAGEVETHIIEFVENSVDFSHFSHIHGAMRLPWTSIRLPWIRIRHDPSWFVDETLEHVAYFRNDVVLEIRGRVYESTRASALITIFGPGGVVKFEFDIPRIGEITMFQTHTPVEPMKQRVHFRWFAPRSVPGMFVSYVVGNWISQWKEDLDIWKRKIYRKRPLETKGEGPLLGNMRKWYRQFYPDHDLLGEKISGD